MENGYEDYVIFRRPRGFVVRYFILVAAPAERFSGRDIPAHNVIHWRLGNKVWPIYKNTRNKKRIMEGDRFVFYSAGTGENSQTFCAVATAASQVIRRLVRDHKDWVTITASLGVFLDRIRIFQKPIPIRPLLNSLALCKGSRKWGAYLQGGCVTISKEDYDLIVRSGKLGKIRD
jgi:hypothetical protein